MNAAERAKLIFQVSFYLSWGFQQQEIAQDLGISQQMVSYYRRSLRVQYENEMKELNE